MGPHPLPEFSFRRARHDRLTDRRGDHEFLEAAWADPTTKVVAIRDLKVAVTADGAALATRSASAAGLTAAPTAPMLLGRVGEVVHFLIIEDGSAPQAEVAPGTAFLPLRAIATTLDEAEASLAVHAVALAHWHARHTRCAVCGGQTTITMSGECRRCTGCEAQHFPRTDPAVIMLVVDDGNRCLLGHNSARDEAWYSTLAGFVEPGESLEDAVVREVAEETGVIVDEVAYAGSQPWPFPSSLMVGFQAHACDTTITVDGVEITEARWFSRAQLRADVESGALVIPSTISISGALLQSWYGAPLPVRKD